MKKIILSAAIFAACSFSAFAQSPDGFKYQAVVRDASQNIIPNQAVGVQITILQGSANGTIVYQETFSEITNAYGLINISIGNGTVTQGTFSLIDWSAGPYFIETALDASGGTNYTVMGTSQLLSVPYALYAKTAENVTNDNVNDADADPTNEYNMSVALNGTNLEVTDGGGMISTDLSSLQDGVNDADADPTNELQTLSINGDTIFLTNGDSVIIPNDNDWGKNGNDIFNLNNGNVGVGISNPSARLHVLGPVNTDANPNTATPVAIFDNASGSQQTIIKLNTAGVLTASIRADVFGNLLLNGNGAGSLYLANDGGSGDVMFSNGSGGVHSAFKGSGMLGIGTTSPSTKLHVVGNNNAVIVEDAGNGRQLSLYGNGEIESSAGATLSLNRFNSENIRLVAGGGNVGIGNIIAQSKLQIENNVATGALDNFNEYQILLHSNPTATSSYGFGIRGNTLVYNSNVQHDFDIDGVTAITINANGIAQEAWQNATLVNGWSNFGSGYTTAQYYKDKEGVIHVKGVVVGGSGVIFNLPAGYRPNDIRIMAGQSDDAGQGTSVRIDVKPNGDVTLANTLSNAFSFVSMEFSFRP